MGVLVEARAKCCEASREGGRPVFKGSVCVRVCVMVRIRGTEDKGLRTDRVLGGGSSVGHPESQRGHVGKRKEWLCLLFGFRGAVCVSGVA